MSAAYVFGKGPSLDGFDFSKMPPLADAPRVAINEAVMVVPGPCAWVAQDYDVVRRVAGGFRRDPLGVLFTRPDCVAQFRELLAHGPLPWKAGVVAHWDASVPQKSPTIVGALWFVNYLSAMRERVDEVRLVGCDRYFRPEAAAVYASAVKATTTEDIEKCYARCPYDGINAAIDAAALRWGLRLVEGV